MSHQARVSSNCPEALRNTSPRIHEASPWGKVLPGHPENQDAVLQASWVSQALQLIPGENRGMREGSGEGGGVGSAGTHWEVVSTVWRKTSDIFLTYVIF